MEVQATTVKAMVPVVIALIAVLFAYMVWNEHKPEPPKAPMVKSKSGNLLISSQIIKEDKIAVADALCQMICAEAKHSIVTTGRFVLAVAGGSCLDSLENLARTVPGMVEWQKVTLVYANHKCIAPSEANSTHAKVLHKFASALGMTVVAPHPAPKMGTDGTEEAAYYQRALEAAGNKEVPDFVVLGLGVDGHVAGLHPGSMAMSSIENRVVAAPKGGGEPPSVTMSMAMLNKAGRVVVVVTGGDKKDAVARALRNDQEPHIDFPAQSLINPIFIMDKAAASAL
eukprot:CAMPEP_0185744532 /NCGR_PEP_ID=MMETSP1174-20130828/2698_1 /TAXON_ID=35687 /ORGANISM="Dictyocha speculum, Strain CCMP1381" /LENGTH=283 /DNA_ID=CAMNT_0028418003 /DNA_START=52 /DNA_END=906 /DNA_ORIENTATION=+